jgi:diguanylate cyclase (GGDEF)-like protein
MPDEPALPSPDTPTWRIPSSAWVLALLALGAATAVATFWLGRAGLIGGLLVLAGGLSGALLATRQLSADVSALLADRLADLGPGRTLQPPQAGTATGPLLLPVAAALGTLVERQQALFEAQAAQLESLRQLAHTDALTGLANRRHFMAMLDGSLCHGETPIEAGLVLLRVRDLQGLNQRLGHAGADRVLQALAQALQAYPDRIGRCCAGRLNGSDFALLLPVGGMAFETAAALVQALRVPFTQIDALASVDAGVVELSLPMNATQALALADAALARAEAEGGFAVPSTDLELPLVDEVLPLGEATWQRRIARALVKGQVALGAYPVRTADGRQLLLDCPLRVQLQPDGPLEPAARWLALAQRTRLCAAVDEKALTLALEAIALDGQPRCVNVAGQSLESMEFVAAVAQRLQAAPAAACRLWIDLPESLALEQPMRVREVSRLWRPLGVMLGLEHAGESLTRIPGLIDLGLDCVRIDRRFVNDVVGEAAEDARRYLQGLVKLVQAVGLQVTAEGVRSAADLDVLWALGFDAATGPALVPEPAVAA